MENIDAATLTSNYLKFKQEFDGMGYRFLNTHGEQLSLWNASNQKIYPLTNCRMEEKTLTAVCVTDEGILNIMLGEDSFSIILMSFDNKQILRKIESNTKSGKKEIIVEGQRELEGISIFYGLHKKDGYNAVKITGTTTNKAICNFEQSIEINSRTKQVNYLSSLIDYTHLISKSGQVSIMTSKEDNNLHYVVVDYVSNRPDNPRTIINKSITPEEGTKGISAIVNTSVIKDLSYSVRDALNKIFAFDKVTLGSLLPLPINFHHTSIESIKDMIALTEDNLKQVTIPETLQLGQIDMHR